MIVRPKQPVAIGHRVLGPGDLFDDTHSIVRQYPDMFEPVVGETDEPPVERATARPGDKRTTKRPAKKPATKS